MTNLATTGHFEVVRDVEPKRLTPLGREAGFLRDMRTVAGRALRQLPREPESILPAVFVPTFFYLVNLGALESVTQHISSLNYKAFLLPMAVAFAVTGVSRAPRLVTDIQSGYFDRLRTTPIRPLALLLGLMAADVAVVMALTIPILILGLCIGVHFSTGFSGIVVFVAVSGIWGLAFTGFPYAVALKTGNPAAVSATFIVFFPFAFLTDAVVPRQFLTGWFASIASYNPVTYVLGALRSVITSGWQLVPITEGLLAIIAVGVVSIALALGALRGRIRRGA